MGERDWVMLTIPRNWIDGEKLTAVKFNEQIEENLEWVRNRNINVVTIRNGVTDWVQSTTGVWQPIDPTLLYVKITTSGGDIKITANLNIYNSGVGGITFLDFYVQPHDKTPFFLSSLTSTPLANGLFEEKLGSSYANRQSFNFLWVNPDPNSYKITVYWNAAVGSNNLNYTNTVNFLIAEEYGVMA